MAQFNRTNENIGWAGHSWNPVTGCLGPNGDGRLCPYCYAKKIADRFYSEKFKPTFHPERLDAPQNTKVPKNGNNRVFVCSMGELFGPWVPDEWVNQILEVVRENSQWTFLFLTKWPKRLSSLDWPENAWIGATIDRQIGVEAVTTAFEKIQPVKGRSKLFISCEPLLENLELYSELLETLDWIIIGALSKGKEKVQPNSIWVSNILREAEEYEIPVWMKDNLKFLVQETP